jgi:hypothetical protein
VTICKAAAINPYLIPLEEFSCLHFPQQRRLKAPIIVPVPGKIVLKRQKIMAKNIGSMGTAFRKTPIFSFTSTTSSLVILPSLFSM